MKVPANLLNAASGRGQHNKGMALFAVFVMALAGMGGLIWGVWAKFAKPAPLTSGLKCPAKTLPPPAPQPFVCDACGMG